MHENVKNRMGEGEREVMYKYVNEFDLKERQRHDIEQTCCFI